MLSLSSSSSVYIYRERDRADGPIVYPVSICPAGWIFRSEELRLGRASYWDTHVEWRVQFLGRLWMAIEPNTLSQRRATLLYGQKENQNLVRPFIVKVNSNYKNRWKRWKICPFYLFTTRERLWDGKEVDHIRSAVRSGNAASIKFKCWNDRASQLSI